MSPQAILIILIVAPTAGLVFWRVNAALVFLSLCLGNVLAVYATKDALAIVSGASTTMRTSDTIVRLSLLLVPPALTALCMIKTVKGNKRLFNILPAAGTGLLTALLVVPQLPPGLMRTLVQSTLWSDIMQLQSGIVALSALVCLGSLWLQRPKSHHDDEKPGKKKA